MSATALQLGQIIVDGAARAASLLPLALAINVATPAQAQLPRASLPPVRITAQAAPTVVLDPASSSAPLALKRSHLDVTVSGQRALVRTTLVYRNDGTLPVQALTTLPEPAVVYGPYDEVLAMADTEQEDAFGCADEPAALAQFAEAGEPATRYQQHTLHVAPGEEITIELRRPAALLVRGNRYRLVLPLAADRNAAFVPQFSADVVIDAAAPLRALASATHRGEVSGINESQARLTVPNGPAYGNGFFAFDFELDLPAPAVAQRTAPVVADGVTSPGAKPAARPTAKGSANLAALNSAVSR